MSIKYFVFTDRPNRSAARVTVHQNSTGLWRVVADSTWDGTLNAAKCYTPVESPPGVYTLAIPEPLTDDTYRGYYWRTGSSFTDSPQVAVITLVSDAEPVATASIVKQDVRDAMLMAPTPGAPASGSIDDILTTTGVLFGNYAHGGAAATITTTSGEVGLLAKFAAKDAYLVADWLPAGFDAAFDGTLAGYVDVYVSAGLSSAEIGAATILGRYTTAGGWVPDVAFDGRKQGIVVLDANGVTVAGTLTLTIPAAAEAPLTIPIPLRVTAVGGYEYGPVYRDGSGMCWYTYGGGGRNIAVAGVDAATIAAAVRDVDNTTPAAGSLGEAINDILDDTAEIGVAGAGLTALPAVTLANGAHGGAAASFELEHVTVTSTTLNQHAVRLIGNGAGAGLVAKGGDDGGEGIVAVGGDNSGHGIYTYAPGSGAGLMAQSGGTFPGIWGLAMDAGGNGMTLTKGTGGKDIDADEIDASGSGATPQEIWEYTTRTLTSDPGAGAGDILFTWVEYQNGHQGDASYVVPDVSVRVYSNDQAIGTPDAKGMTDETGSVQFYLNTGTYYFFRRKSGRTFTNPVTVEVS